MESSENKDVVLETHAKHYIYLIRRYGCDAKSVSDEFNNLRTLVQVEIYFMKSVRDMISEEEMSGFILYLDDFRMRAILDNYNPQLCSFSNYLKMVMERRAKDYLSIINRKRVLDNAYAKLYLPYEPDNPLNGVAEISPEYGIEEEYDTESTGPSLKEKLRFICSRRPTVQKRMFVFLCTLLPYLSMDIIDETCDTICCNSTQTKAIAELLYRLMQENKSERSRSNRDFFTYRRDFVWRRTVELETALSMIETDNTMKTQARKKLDYQRQQLRSISDRNRNIKHKVEYPLLGQLLNIDVNYISASVFHSKRLLDMLVNGSTGCPINKAVRQLLKTDSQTIRSSRAKDLVPFEVFNVTVAETAMLNS